MQHPHRFDETDQVWVWEYKTEAEDGSTGHNDLYMDPGEEIRFRVTSELFIDTSPTAENLGENVSNINVTHLQGKGTNSTQLPSTSATATVLDNEGNRSEERKIPFHLKASINEPGLGLLTWWNNS